MAAEHYKPSIVNALSSGDNSKAVKLLYEWQQADKHALVDPAFFTAKAIVHLRNGNIEAASHNMNKSLDLMEK